MGHVKLDRSSAWVVAQALISGQVVDRITSFPISNFTIRLLDSNDQGIEIKPEKLGLKLKHTLDGLFAFYGSPSNVFPDKKIYKLKIEVSALGYKTETKALTIGPLEPQPVLVTFSPPVLEGDKFSVGLFRGNGLPRRGIKFDLSVVTP